MDSEEVIKKIIENRDRNWTKEEKKKMKCNILFPTLQTTIEVI